MSDIGSVSLTYGVGYTTEDRDSSRQFWGAQNSHSEDATALQVFAEAAYNDLYVGTVNVAPYFGYSWLRIETDGFTESAQGTNFRMQDTEDDVHVATVGARVTAPVMVGKMPVAFLSNNDITGGNSGSPVLNADGELIGLAFDGNWESMSSDIMFEPDLQRCINVDIRYVLFIVDKFGGAGYLLDEMDIVK